jgi:hypothetical protein
MDTNTVLTLFVDMERKVIFFVELKLFTISESTQNDLQNRVSDLRTISELIVLRFEE